MPADCGVSQIAEQPSDPDCLVALLAYRLGLGSGSSRVGGRLMERGLCPFGEDRGEARVEVGGEQWLGSVFHHVNVTDFHAPPIRT